jgi:Effector Associated Constant Component 1
MATAEASINVRLAGLGLGHPAAQAAIAELLADLRRAPQLPAREYEASSEGVKGGSLEILVTLGTSGAIASLVQIVKLWLTRDRRRSLVVSVRNTADGVDINIEGEQISVAALTQALASTAKLGGAVGKDGA